ncbi:MAG: hypothetical protein ACE5HV_17410, partial [Acidobacteriota bacterium]
MSGRPLPGIPPALAFGRVPMVAWLQAGPKGVDRVVGATPPEAPLQQLGPTGGGSDGLPAATAGANGELWVFAARSDGTGSRLWAQPFRRGRWQSPLAGPRARTWDHHPAAAASGDGGLWLVWVSEGERPAAAGLFASHWNGNFWSPAEPLPAASGTPMAPSID